MATTQLPLFIADKLKGIPLVSDIGWRDRHSNQTTKQTQKVASKRAVRVLNDAATDTLLAAKKTTSPPTDTQTTAHRTQTNNISKILTVKKLLRPSEPVGQSNASAVTNATANSNGSDVAKRILSDASAEFQRSSQNNIGLLGYNTRRTLDQQDKSAGERWALFSRPDGRMSMFEAFALVANMMLVGTILLALFFLCTKRRRRKTNRTASSAIVGPQIDCSNGLWRPGSVVASIAISESPIVANGARSARLESSNSVTSVSPRVQPTTVFTMDTKATGEERPPAERLRERPIGTGESLSSSSSLASIELPDSTCVLIGTKEPREAMDLVDKESSHSAITHQGPLEELKVDWIELDDKHFSEAAADRVPSSQVHLAKLDRRQTELQLVDVRDDSIAQNLGRVPVGMANSMGELQSVGWISMDGVAVAQAPPPYSGLSGASSPLDDEDEHTKPDQQLAAKAESSMQQGTNSDTGQEDDQGAADRLRRRKYFVYLVHDGQSTTSKECVAQLELEPRKRILLTELRQIIANSHDIGLTSIRRNKFKFVTETYRLLNENEDATLLHQVYPTQGVFVKVTGTEQEIRSGTYGQTPPTSGKTDSLTSKRGRQGELPALVVQTPSEKRPVDKRKQLVRAGNKTAPTSTRRPAPLRRTRSSDNPKPSQLAKTDTDEAQ